MSWSEILDLPATRGSLHDVISGGPGFVAFGNDADIDFGTPYVWTSSDGRHWTNVTFGDDTAYGSVSGIARHQGRFIAAGGLIGDSGAGSGQAVVWTSPDASAWTQTELDANQARGARALAPVQFGGQLVMVGSAYSPRIGRVWASADATAWQVQPDDPGLEGADMYDITVIGDRLVAVGALWGADSDFRPAIWDSIDGRSWSRTYLGPCCDTILQIAVWDAAAFAFAAGVVYRSDDGGEWELAGTIDGFHGNVVKVIDTLTYGRVAVGNGPDGSVLLVPPAN